MFTPLVNFCFCTESTVELIREMEILGVIVSVFFFMPETGQRQASHMWKNWRDCRGLGQLQASTLGRRTHACAQDRKCLAVKKEKERPGSVLRGTRVSRLDCDVATELLLKIFVI